MMDIRITKKQAEEIKEGRAVKEFTMIFSSEYPDGVVAGLNKNSGEPVFLIEWTPFGVQPESMRPQEQWENLSTEDWDDLKYMVGGVWTR
jgi:hypothetical protein